MRRELKVFFPRLFSFGLSSANLMRRELKDTLTAAVNDLTACFRESHEERIERWPAIFSNGGSPGRGMRESHEERIERLSCQETP
jgi:hypothetical protein